MMDERAFIRRVEDSDTDEFAQILARPNLEEERALRAHFGEERYKRLHARALRRSVRGAARASRGNVVVIHGIMGGELTAYRGGDSEHIWARVFSLIHGRVRRLRLADDGRADFEQGTQVQATGIMKTAYGEMLLALAERWNVRGFWYDWRYGVCYGRYAPVGSYCQCGPDPGRILPPPRWSDACGTNRGVCRTSPGPVGSPCGCFGDPGRRLP